MIVIVEHYNDYDQHGGYFVGAYESLKEAKEAGYTKFGRLQPYGIADTWYNCHEIDINTDYHFEGEQLLKD